MEFITHSFFQQAIQLMDLQPGERIMELCCGDGWACRQLAERIPEGLVIGLDPSDDHIHDARAKSAAFENVLYLWSAAEQIPWQEDFFTRVVGVDSICHFQDVEKVFREVYRVLAPGGTLWLVVRTYTDRGDEVKMATDMTAPISPATTEEHIARLHQCGYEKVSSFSLQSSSPAAPPVSGDSHSRTGALLLSARKPQV